MSTDTLALDINSDVGESYGAFRIGADVELFPLISSANVACGFHGGDPQTMDQTVRALAGLGVAVGAHPSYHDLRGFGRRNIPATPEEIRTDLLYQIGALHAFCQVAGVPLHHVKPHGALYNTATNDRIIADAIVNAVLDLAPDVIFYALPGSELEAAAVAQGLRVAREAFADRAYMSDGTLAPRSLAGAVLEDPASVADRVLRMIGGEEVPTLDGGHITIAADTICIHSDTPGAVPIASALREALMDAGITIRAL
ncbi:MAG TPA: 5-oxoprolinase subunit PxpA [Thermomicrobiales bacterium]|nr:5-oxoprolinase subunit PxpA [Thermomicrobiales bacterium]